MFHIFRSFLWTMLFICSTVLLGLTGYRIHRTEERHDLFPNVSRYLYDPIIIELLVTSALALLFSIWFTIAIIARLGRGPFGSYASELASLFLVWVMYLVGAAIVTHRYRHLGRCRAEYKICRILEAIKAFSWICWAFTTFLIVASLANMVKRKHNAWGPVHGRADATGTTTTNPQTRQAHTTTTTTAHDNPVTGTQDATTTA